MRGYRTILGVCIVVFIIITIVYLLLHYNERGSISDGTLIWEVAGDYLYQS